VSDNCLFNRKGLKDTSKCSCFYCLKEFKNEDVKFSYSEEMTCPNCNMAAVLPTYGNSIVQYWIAQLSVKTYG